MLIRLSSLRASLLLFRAVATPNGPSIDGALASLNSFQHNEDLEGKVIIVTAEDEGHQGGFWHEKDEFPELTQKALQATIYGR